MAFEIKDGSTWRMAKNVYINDAGNWRTAKTVWLKDGSTWRQSWVLNSATTIGAGGGAYGLDPTLGIGSRSPTTDALGNTFNQLYYSVGADATVFSLAGSNGQFTSYTQNNYGTHHLRVVGGGALAFADAYTFYLQSSDSVVTWAWHGDTLGLQAANGTTVQVQA